MRFLTALAATATLVSAATFMSPANALTPAGLSGARGEIGMTENVARVCREVCRRGFCERQCRWVPNNRQRVRVYEERPSPRVRVYEENRGYRSYGSDVEIRRERRPGIEFRIGPSSDY